MGTLTVGKPTVDDTRQWTDMPQQDFYELIAAAEAWEKATVKSREIVIGNKSFVLDNKIFIPVYAEDTPLEIENIAQTGILVSIEREVVGIVAVSDGTDIAIKAADEVLMRSNLEGVITTIDVSRKTFTRIHLNYLWALGYDILSIPFTAGAIFPFSRLKLPPWIAGAATVASSICVVCSSLLLKNYKRPKAPNNLEMHVIVTEK